MAYAQMSDDEAGVFEPAVVFVDRDNRIVYVGSVPAAVPEYFASELVDGRLA
jgi:aspartate 1-decarboxylase